MLACLPLLVFIVLFVSVVYILLTTNLLLTFFSSISHDTFSSILTRRQKMQCNETAWLVVPPAAVHGSDAPKVKIFLPCWAMCWAI